MPLRQYCSILIVISSVACMASVPTSWTAERQSLVDREQQVWSTPVHDSEFAAVPIPRRQVARRLSLRRLWPRLIH